MGRRIHAPTIRHGERGVATLEYALLLVVMAVPVALAVIAVGLPLLRLYHLTTTVIGLPFF